MRRPGAAICAAIAATCCYCYELLSLVKGRTGRTWRWGQPRIPPRLLLLPWLWLVEMMQCPTLRDALNAKHALFTHFVKETIRKGLDVKRTIRYTLMLCLNEEASYVAGLYGVVRILEQSVSLWGVLRQS
jgi:hypothetical protein